MNFLFVDRILSYHPGKQTVGVKYVTPHDSYLTVQPDQSYSLFPCVVGEALGQLCSWNVLKTSDFRYRPVGGVIQDIQMFNDAKIGDAIFLESDIESLDTENQLVSFSGRASVNGETLLTVSHSLAPLLPLEEFNHLDQVQKDFEKLLCHPERSEGPPSAAQFSREVLRCAQDDTVPTIFPIAYDAILTQIPGQEIIAKKSIPLTTPYFVDHFPKQPVLPLSLLLEYNLQLAHSFMAEQGKDHSFRPQRVRKVKISQFIRPGDEVITRVTLKKQTPDGFTVQFQNEVNNKKVCVAEADFSLPGGHAALCTPYDLTK